MLINTPLRSLCMGLALLTLLSFEATAAVPTSSAIEGVLTSAGGGAAADGSYKMTFSIYDGKAAKSASWQESGVDVKVTNGRFSYALGTKKPLSAKALAGLSQPWLGIKIGTDPELPRQAMGSTPYALVAERANSLSCTGCVNAAAIANNGISASKIGFTYARSSSKGGPALDLTCTGCVSVKELKFDGNVNLGSFDIKAKNAIFTADLSANTMTATSFIGDGSKLTGLKTPKGICAKAGEVVKGINGDGTLKCVKALDPTAIPRDGLNEISNDLITNQFIDTITTTDTKIAIPDNQGKEAISNISFPDIGTAQTFSVYVHVENTDLSNVSMVILPPDDKKTGWTLCDPCGKKNEKLFKRTFSPTAKPKSGDIGKWVGMNPKGLWNLKVSDSDFCVVQLKGNAKYCDTAPKKMTDGWIASWRIKIQTLSNKKIAVNADQYNAGNLTVAKTLTVNGATKLNSSVSVAGKMAVKGPITMAGGTLNGNFKYLGISKDWRNTSKGTWRNIPGRGFKYTKLRDSSIVRVVYQDTLGTLGTGYGQCMWRIVVGGKIISTFSAADITYGYAWRMENASHTGLSVGLKKGTYTVEVHSLNSAATECLMGWNTTGSFISAEEVGG